MSCAQITAGVQHKIALNAKILVCLDAGAWM